MFKFFVRAYGWLLLLFSLSAFAITSKNVSLLGTLDLTSSGERASKGNDVWGWTDPLTKKEYAIMGLNSKTSIVEVTIPSSPKHIGDIKTQRYSSTWRDMKVYKNYLYIVSEAYGHGMQIFDLTKIRNLKTQTPHIFTEYLHYSKFGSAHNLIINEDSGFAYAAGTSTCDGGLHVIDLKNPTNPEFVTCIGRNVYEIPGDHGDAYTHDAQCVIYHGPDQQYYGREICVSSNENTVNIVDVTDKANAYQISATTYNNVAYTHQGWLSQDHRYFFLGDELDEKRLSVNTRTFVWDFTDLDNPILKSVYSGPTKAIDHNMYSKGHHLYQGNYTAGLRILNVSDINNIFEEAFIDFTDDNDPTSFKSIWSVFPYFKSKTVLASSIDGRLFIVRPNL